MGLKPTSNVFFTHLQKVIFEGIFEIPEGPEFNGVRKGSSLYLLNMISCQEFRSAMHFINIVLHF